MRFKLGLSRRSVLLASFLVALPGWAYANPSDSSRPITMVVPYPAGGSLDTIGRPLTQSFQKATNQPLILENVGGAAGLIAAAKVVQSKADGHTLLMASNGQVTIAPYIYKEMSYNPATDLLPVIHLVDQTAVLYASTESPYKTFRDLETAVKSDQANIQFASTGHGGISHLAQELLAQKMGAKFTHVPYRGAAPALQDLAGGQVPLLFTFVGSAKGLTASGKVRPLAVAGKTRLSSLPDVPTFAELGYPDVEVSTWIGLMAPKGTPADKITKLGTVFNQLLNEPDFRALMDSNNIEIKGGSVEQFQAMMQADAQRWAALAKEVNLATQ
jgi:tripartite-type tricarboxylate transporter receptor subunit TctC